MAYYDLGYQFWWNKHFETGKPILTVHHPASGICVLPDVEWHDRDFSNINLDYSASEPFFTQLRKLQVQIPLPANHNVTEPHNSIALLSFGDRNSYFVFGCISKNSFYSVGAMNTEGSSLVSLSSNITNSHHISHSNRIFNCYYASESRDCMDSAFIFDCHNCQYCFGASNKRNKKYLWFNEQLSETEWRQKRELVDFGKRSELYNWRKKFDQLLFDSGIWPENFNTGSSDSSGDYLTGAVRCHHCFGAEDTAVDAYCSAWIFGNPQTNIFMWGILDSSNSYMSVTSPKSNQIKFCNRITQCDTCEYCMSCVNCSNCFGCIGIKRKEFCIFNKQYSESEYWQRVDELKCAMLDRGEYGQYFPTEMSTTFVPECGAVVYAGASEADLELLGGQRFDVNADGAVAKYDETKLKNAADVPDSIDDVGDDWVGVPIYDEKAKRAFAYLKPELEHYRRVRIAPPTEHFISRVNAVTHSGQVACLENKKCAKCDQAILTSKNPTYPNRTIYCKPCYFAYLEQNG
ncbi:TPA: hypothetical protein DCZ32_03165 [Candidatus Uhrbacteria bacterium]|nr:hypothetical protein [Candidatus Uhrbacteria bacterium]